MVSFGWRLKRSDLDLIRKASAVEQISQAEFLRLALRERAEHVLGSASKGEFSRKTGTPV